jgi:hypothetical protein
MVKSAASRTLVKYCYAKTAVDTSGKSLAVSSSP